MPLVTPHPGLNYHFSFKLKPFCISISWYYIKRGGKYPTWILLMFCVGYTTFFDVHAEGYVFQLILPQPNDGVSRFKGLYWRRLVKRPTINVVYKDD